MDEPEPHICMNNLPERGGVIQGFEAYKPSGENDSSVLIPRSPRPLCQVQPSVSGMFGHSGSADRAGDSEFEAIGTDRSEDEGLSGDSTATRVSEAAERSLATTDGLISIINKQVEDALLPLLSVLRGVEEDEHKHQEKLLAIEKRKLALKNEKIQLFTRHGAPSWNSPVSKPQVALANFMGNAGSTPEPAKDGTEEKGAVSARPNSGSDGILQPSMLSKSDVTKCRTPDDENLPIANKLVAFPDVGSCLSDGSNEGVHSDEFKDQIEGDPRHSDKNLPNLDKVVACSIVRSFLSDDSNARDRSDEPKDRLFDGDHSHSVDLPKLDKVERRGDLGHFREDWVEKTEKLVFGDPSGPPKIVMKDETPDDTKRVRLFGQILTVPVMRPFSPGWTFKPDNFRPRIGGKLMEYGDLNSKSCSTLSEEGEPKECEHSLGNYKNLPKRDKVVACPRCGSLDTKFCYYNNNNVNHPRHFCKSCQRYWTEGMALRNFPVWGGRRKNKYGGELHRKTSQISLTLRGPTPSPEIASTFDPYSFPLHQNGRLAFQSYASSQGSLTSGTEPSAEKSSECTLPFYRGLAPSLFTEDAFNAIRTGFTSPIMSRTTYRHIASNDMSILKDKWEYFGTCVSSAGQQHQPVSALGKRSASDGGRQDAKALRRSSVLCKSEIVNPTLKPKLELARACEQGNSFMSSDLYIK